MTGYDWTKELYIGCTWLFPDGYNREEFYQVFIILPAFAIFYQAQKSLRDSFENHPWFSQPTLIYLDISDKNFCETL